MEYKIAVCDDADVARHYITEMVQNWAEANGHQVRIREFSSAESFLFDYEEEQDFDVLLLDIEMGDMDGVALAKQVRRKNDVVQIVFITGYSDYISEGYEVDALHYLMKPVKEEKLSEVLNRAEKRLKNQEKRLNLEVSGTRVRIPLGQIRYADVQGNYVTIHAEEDYTVKMTLHETESLLDDRFYRAGRSLLVNLSCIRKVTKSEIYMTEGIVLPLPRHAYEGVNRAIIERM